MPINSQNGRVHSAADKKSSLPLAYAACIGRISLQQKYYGIGWYLPRRWEKQDKNKSGVWINWLLAYKPVISETVKDGAKVTINGYIKSYTGFPLPPKCMTLNDL